MACARACARLGYHVVEQPRRPARRASTSSRRCDDAGRRLLDALRLRAAVLSEPRGRRPCCTAAARATRRAFSLAQIAAAERLRAKARSRIGLLFVVGEERGSDGAQAANALAPGSRFLINGEPTDNRLGRATRGVYRVKLHATGRAAHSSLPQLGESAIDKLIDALVGCARIDWPVDPDLGATFYSVGLINGGVAPNVISPHAEAEVMFRTIERAGAAARADGSAARRARVARRTSSSCRRCACPRCRASTRPCSRSPRTRPRAGTAGATSSARFAGPAARFGRADARRQPGAPHGRATPSSSPPAAVLRTTPAPRP